jgi:hypothetical protein
MHSDREPEQPIEEATAPAVALEPLEAPPAVAQAPGPAPVAAAPPPAPARRWPWAALLSWLPAAVVAIFPILFLMTALPRINVPFELEWNEGHSAEQSWRFAKGLPLYPPASENWVPYMYAPLYHILHGAVMALGDWYSLVPGRWISLLSSLLTALAIVAIVRDQSRRWAPAVAAGFLYFAYYKPTGFWYDIVRVDALAFALAVWGLFFVLRRHPREWQVVLGVILLGLATWAKQTNGLIAVIGGVVALLRAPRPAILGGFAMAVFTFNAVFLFQRSGSSEFVKYVYTNAVRHPSAHNVFFPNYLWPDQFLQQVPNADSWLSRAATYWRLHQAGPPAQVWTDGLRHVWLLAALVAAWLVVSLVRWRRPRGWQWLLPGVPMIVLALQSLAKYGGYINNYLPVFLVMCLLTGLAMAGLQRAFRARWWRAAVPVVVAVVLALQVLQPWRLPAAGNAEANWNMRKQDPVAERFDAMGVYTDWLRRRDEAAAAGAPFTDPRPEAATAAIRRHHLIGRWVMSGLGWFPSHQQPSAGSAEAYKRMMEWLRAKAEANEPVLVMHHQWYGLLAGHPMGVNVDMVRCAVWAGDPIPETFLRDLRQGRYKWLVLGRERLEWDWLAGNLIDTLRQHYDYVGQLPALKGLEGRALMPVTGAEMRPAAVYRFKGFKGTLDK